MIAATIELIFRSPEGVIRYLGQYLDGAEIDPRHTFRVGTQPLFSLTSGGANGAIVSTQLLGKRYSILNDENRRRNMMILALVEQLINLHKESSDRPVTVPVQLVP